VGSTTPFSPLSLSPPVATKSSPPAVAKDAPLRAIRLLACQPLFLVRALYAGGASDNEFSSDSFTWDDAAPFRNQRQPSLNELFFFQLFSSERINFISPSSFPRVRSHVVLESSARFPSRLGTFLFPPHLAYALFPSLFSFFARSLALDDTILSCPRAVVTSEGLRFLCLAAWIVPFRSLFL